MGSSVAETHRWALEGLIEGLPCRYVLAPGLNRLGSASSSEVRLVARGVSKRHALLDVRQGEISLEDLASKNGTWVNGRRAEASRVQRGDEIGLGPVRLRLIEVPIEDARLAVEASAANAPTRAAAATSALPAGSPSAAQASWLPLIEAYVDQIRPPEGLLSSGLSVMVDALGLRTARLLEINEGCPAVELAACGDRDRPNPPAPARGAGRGVDHADDPKGWTVAYASRSGGRRLALGLYGDPTLRHEAIPLLGTLLHLALALRPDLFCETPPVTHRSSAATPGLRFPAGYVPGASAAMAALHAQLQSLAHSELPILILGETGSGKEWVARILHDSKHHSRPFVAINCAAIPAELLEAELFGIGKEVATGVRPRQGRFQLAQGGTLFLDEIGDMRPALQAKLLRVLEEKVVQPLGCAPEPVDVRVLAATNEEPEKTMARGALRRDLYYRLAGSVVRVPPMRQRAEDIPGLVEHFLRCANQEIGKGVRGVTVAAMEELTQRPWPGNVRQLEHEIRRLVHLCPDGQAIHVDLLEPVPLQPAPEAVVEPTTPSPPADSLPLARVDRLHLAEIEKQVVAEALRRHGGHRRRTAQALGISREALRRRMRRFDLT